MTRTRTTLLTAAGIAVSGLAGVAFGMNPANGAVPNCGGNNHQWQAPVTCTNSRVIDGTNFTVVVNEQLGGFLSVAFSFPARTVPTTLTVKSHTGRSGSNQGVVDPVVTVPPGGTSAVLTIAVAGCGQVDVHAVLVGPGASSGRIAGPWINNSSCTPIETTTTGVPTSITPPTTSPTSSPGTTRPGSSTPTAPAVTPVPHGSVTAGTLPQTGSGSLPMAYAGAGLVAVGLAGLIVVARRRVGA